jgi:hypothetical protein
VSLTDKKNKTHVTYEFHVTGDDAEELYTLAEMKAGGFFGPEVEYQLTLDVKNTPVHLGGTQPYMAHCTARRIINWEAGDD